MLYLWFTLQWKGDFLSSFSVNQTLRPPKCCLQGVKGSIGIPMSKDSASFLFAQEIYSTWGSSDLTQRSGKIISDYWVKSGERWQQFLKRWLCIAASKDQLTTGGELVGFKIETNFFKIKIKCLYRTKLAVYLLQRFTWFTHWLWCNV